MYITFGLLWEDFFLFCTALLFHYLGTKGVYRRPLSASKALTLGNISQLEPDLLQGSAQKAIISIQGFDLRTYKLTGSWPVPKNHMEQESCWVICCYFSFFRLASLLCFTKGFIEWIPPTPLCKLPVVIRLKDIVPWILCL